jgi:hypothetical protein
MASYSYSLIPVRLERSLHQTCLSQKLPSKRQDVRSFCHRLKQFLLESLFYCYHICLDRYNSYINLSMNMMNIIEVKKKDITIWVVDCSCRFRSNLLCHCHGLYWCFFWVLYDTIFVVGADEEFLCNLNPS